MSKVKYTEYGDALKLGNEIAVEVSNLLHKEVKLRVTAGCDYWANSQIRFLNCDAKEIYPIKKELLKKFKGRIVRIELCDPNYDHPVYPLIILNDKDSDSKWTIIVAE